MKIMIKSESGTGFNQIIMIEYLSENVVILLGKNHRIVKTCIWQGWPNLRWPRRFPRSSDILAESWWLYWKYWRKVGKGQHVERARTQNNVVHNALLGLRGGPGGHRKGINGQSMRGNVLEICKRPSVALSLVQEKELLRRWWAGEDMLVMIRVWTEELFRL